jgi:hypothetical protein
MPISKVTTGSITDSVAIDTDTLVVDSTNNRVGIGTSSPDFALDVASEIGIAEGNALAWHDGSGGRAFDMYASGADNSLRFRVTGSSEAMRIDSSGRVGIGTSSPAVPLHVKASAPEFSLQTSGSLTSGTRANFNVYNSDVSTVGSISFGAVTDNVGTDIKFLNRPAGGSLTERMRIDSGGFLRCAGVYNQSAADSANVVVDATGNIYRSTSALKYKQDIRDIEEIDISQFRPIRYKSNLNRDDQTKDHFGFIADEAHDAGYTELVSYGAVNEETGVAEVEGFRYDRMTVLLTKVVQQQQETITALEARIAALEAN